MIRDSRTLYGPQPHATVAEIEAYWQAFANKHGPYNPNLGTHEQPTGEIKRSRTRLLAYVSDNRWVADCPCGGGIGCWPEHDYGCCHDCLTAHPIEFPHPNTIRAAEAILDVRPSEARNWLPDVEDIADLKVENVTRGYPLKGPLGGGSS